MKAMLEYTTGEEWQHSHHVPTEKGQYVLMIRDPRDSFASHWRLYQHDHPGTQATELEYIDLFLKGNHPSHDHWNIGWMPHTQALLEWFSNHMTSTPLIRYEWLYAYPARELRYALLQMSRFGAPLERVQEAIQLTRGKRCDPSTLPVDDMMGKPGKRGMLQKSTLDALLDYCGPLMEELGYLSPRGIDDSYGERLQDDVWGA